MVHDAFRDKQVAPTGTTATERELDVLVEQVQPFVEGAHRLQVVEPKQHRATRPELDLVGVIELTAIRLEVTAIEPYQSLFTTVPTLFTTRNAGAVRPTENQRGTASTTMSISLPPSPRTTGVADGASRSNPASVPRRRRLERRCVRSRRSTRTAARARRSPDPSATESVGRGTQPMPSFGPAGETSVALRPHDDDLGLGHASADSGTVEALSTMRISKSPCHVVADSVSTHHLVRPPPL